MASKSEHLTRLIEVLTRECHIGYHCLQYWHGLDAFRTAQPTAYRLCASFFETAQFALGERALLGLVRLTDKSKGTTKLADLLTYASKNLDAFRACEPERAKLKVEEAQARYDALVEPGGAVETIRQHRNAHFVHPTSEYVLLGDDSKLASHPMSYRDLRGIYQRMFEVIAPIRSAHEDASMQMEIVGPEHNLRVLASHLAYSAEHLPEARKTKARAEIQQTRERMKTRDRRESEQQAKAALAEFEQEIERICMRAPQEARSDTLSQAISGLRELTRQMRGE